MDRKEGVVTNNNTMAIDTGKFTGRSPKDKWIVNQPPSNENIWWGDVNQSMKPEVFEELQHKVETEFCD